MKNWRFTMKDGRVIDGAGRVPDAAMKRLKIVFADVQRYVEVLSSVTPDGVEVKIGQRWRDRDTRMNGRECEVVGVADGRAHLRRWSKWGGAHGALTKIAISRMRSTSTGWELVKDV